MIRIGIGVEGPSDYTFWTKVLPRHFAGAGVVFRVSVMHGRSKLIGGAERLLAAFASTGCAAVFLIVDKDKDPCMTSVYDEFSDELKSRLRSQANQPVCRLCIADRDLESWYLADEEAMREFLGLSNYSAPTGDDRVGGKGKLQKLLIEHASEGAALNEIAIAKQVSMSFRPGNAARNSASFAYFWRKLESAIAAARGGAA